MFQYGIQEDNGILFDRSYPPRIVTVDLDLKNAYDVSFISILFTTSNTLNINIVDPDPFQMKGRAISVFDVTLS